MKRGSTQTERVPREGLGIAGGLGLVSRAWPFPGRSCEFAAIAGDAVRRAFAGVLAFPAIGSAVDAGDATFLPSCVCSPASRSPVTALASAPDPRIVAGRLRITGPDRLPPAAPGVGQFDLGASLVRSPRARVPFSTCQPRRSVREEPPLGPSRYGVRRTVRHPCRWFGSPLRILSPRVSDECVT
jgi:hypothetical protein